MGILSMKVFIILVNDHNIVHPDSLCILYRGYCPYPLYVRQEGVNDMEQCKHHAPLLL